MTYKACQRVLPMFKRKQEIKRIEDIIYFCPYCGTQIDASINYNQPSNKICKNCGITSGELINIYKNPISSYKICLGCHEISDSRSDFCIDCGSILQDKILRSTGKSEKYYLTPIRIYEKKEEIKKKATTSEKKKEY